MVHLAILREYKLTLWPNYYFPPSFLIGFPYHLCRNRNINSGCFVRRWVGLGVYQLCKWSEYEIKLENDAEVISTKISQLYRLTLTHFMEQINAMMEGKSILSTEIKQQSKSCDV